MSTTIVIPQEGIARPKGEIYFENATGDDGKLYSLEDAIRYGWIKPNPKFSDGKIGENLFMDQGRQLLAYLFGGQAPVSGNIVTNFAVGTGTTAPNAADTALANQVAFTGSTFRKSINGVDYPAPFVARVEITIGLAEANGNLLTEYGLYSSSDVLYARWQDVGVNKSASFALTMTWRVRF